jgi:hypothetical protein
MPEQINKAARMRRSVGEEEQENQLTAGGHDAWPSRNQGA